MDTKIEIKKEDPLSHDLPSQNEREFFNKNIIIKTKSDSVLLDDCDISIKMEIKSGTPFPDFCSEKHPVKQIKSENVTCSNNCETVTKAEVGAHNETELLPEAPVMKIKEYNSNHEMNNKIEIKEEPWWLERETSSVCDGNKEDSHLTGEGEATGGKSKATAEDFIASTSTSASQAPRHTTKRKFLQCALKTMKVIHKRREKKDECTLFGDLVAEQLRKLNEVSREIAKFNIQKMFYELRMACLNANVKVQ